MSGDETSEPTICPACATGDHANCRVRPIGELMSWRCDCPCTPLTWSRTVDGDPA